MEHQHRRKHLQLNSDSDASNEYIWETKKKEETLFLKEKNGNENHESGRSPSNGPFLTLRVHQGPKSNFDRQIFIFTIGTFWRFFLRFERQKKEEK